MNLSANFNNDIQGKDTSLIPLVLFEDIHIMNPDTLIMQEFISLSTNNITVETVDSTVVGGSSESPYNRPLNYKPLLLSVPSVSQSVDVENRKFKISSVTLSISNYEYEGERFSDLLKSTSLINKTVSIYWKSPTSSVVVPSQVPQSFIDPPAGPSIGIYEEKFCPRIYTGKIRRIAHTPDVVTVELEDLTEQKTTRLLPSVLMGSDEGVLEKYRNKPVPMVYGSVDSSPTVINSIDSKLILDYKPIKRLNQEINTNSALGKVSGLKVSHSDVMCPIPKETQRFMSYWGDGETLDAAAVVGDSQWSYDGYDDNGNYVIDGSNKVTISSSNPLFRAGILQSVIVHKPSSFNIRKPNGDYDLQYGEDSTGEGFSDYLSEDEQKKLTDGVLWTQGSDPDLLVIKENQYSEEWEGSIGGDNVNDLVLRATLKTTLVINFLQGISSKEYTSFGVSIGSKVLPETSCAVLPASDYYGSPQDDWDNSGSGTTFDGFRFLLYGHPTNYEFIVRSVTDEVLNLDQSGMTGYRFKELIAFPNDDSDYDYTSGQSSYVDNAIFRVDSHGIEIYQKVDGVWVQQTANDVSITHPIVVFNGLPNQYRISIVHRVVPDYSDDWDGDAKIIVNSESRFRLDDINCKSALDIEDILSKDFYADVDGRINDNNSLISNPVSIIRHILEEELNYTDFDDSEDGDYQTALTQHSDWVFGFTLHDKQISSKKLIEEIAASTKLHPYFGNDGKFRFNTIKSEYTEDDVSSAIEINESDVISYSFKKTKPEKIATKVDVHYKYDYDKKSYSKKVSDLDTWTFFSPETTLSYYGFETNEENVLQFESKYIRNKTTAEALNGYLYHQNKNQHLLIKLNLPVKFLYIEIGSVLKFPQLLGGISAYGIDYTSDTEIAGLDQTYYPLFYVTSVSQNATGVTVEAIQLHSAVYIPVETDPQYWGCTDDGAINYDQNAAFDDGSCEYEDTTTPDEEHEGVYKSFIEFSSANNFTQTFCLYDFYKDVEKGDWYGGQNIRHYLGKAWDATGDALADNDIGESSGLISGEQARVLFTDREEGNDGQYYLSDAGLYNFLTLFNIGPNLSWMHEITDLAGNVVEGNFYTKDLQPITANSASESPLTGNESSDAWNSDEQVEDFGAVNGDAPLIKVYKKPFAIHPATEDELVAVYYYNKITGELRWNISPDSGESGSGDNNPNGGKITDWPYDTWGGMKKVLTADFKHSDGFMPESWEGACFEVRILNQGKPSLGTEDTNVIFWKPPEKVYGIKYWYNSGNNYDDWDWNPTYDGPPTAQPYGDAAWIPNPEHEGNTDVYFGDNNGDGNVNILDMVRMANHIIGTGLPLADTSHITLQTIGYNTFVDTFMDANQDGTINILDLVMYVQFVLGISSGDMGNGNSLGDLADPLGGG